jgi:hypothetical protein
LPISEQEVLAIHDKTNSRGLPRRRPSARFCAACAGAFATLLVVPSMAAAAVLPAAPGNLASVFGSAQPGDIVSLAPGDYGSFSGGQKPGTVTILASPGVAATMSLSFTNASNIHLEGVTIKGGTIGGNSNHIAVVGSYFTDMTTVDASSMANAGIVFDRDTFDGINATSWSYEGRLSVRGNNNGAPVGVAVTNSHFGNGGCSDGVQIVGGANGVQVGPGNEFSGLKQGSCTAHVDSIQLYGSKNTQIVGNYFHDDDTIIMAPDGGESEVIADNVMVGAGYVPAVQLGSHRGTQFVHNTVKSIEVTMDHKSGASPSSGGVIRDNVFVNGYTNATVAGNCSGCTVSYNLFSSNGNSSGTASIIAAPAFVGGASPASYAGYQLAPGSPGKASASDGTDRGIRIAPAAAPAPVAAAPKASKAPRGPRVSLEVRRRVSWAQLRRGLVVRVSTKVRARVSLRLDRKGSRRPLAWMTRKNPAGTRTYRLKARRGRLGPPHAQTVLLRVRVTNKAGRLTVMNVAIRVRR